MLLAIENLIESPIKLKTTHYELKTNWNNLILCFSKNEYEGIIEKNKFKIELFKKEKADLESKRSVKIKEVLNWLLKKEYDKTANSKIECLKIALISMLPKIEENLTEKTNSIIPSLMSQAPYSRNFAVSRLIDIFALRQRSLVSSIYIKKAQFESLKIRAIENGDRFSALKDNERNFYVDKSVFGWLSLPPFIKFYENKIPFSRLSESEKKLDSLGSIFENQEYVNKLIEQSIFDHESQEEEQLTSERGEKKSKVEFVFRNFMKNHSGANDFTSQLFSQIFLTHYTAKSKFFNPNQAAFFQSVFEFYGISICSLIIFRNISNAYIFKHFEQKNIGRKEK